MFEKRNPALVVVWSLLTFGIYGLYWIVKTQDAIKSRFGMGYNGVATILLMIVTLGIFGFVWYYNLGTVCQKLGGRNYGALFLILCLFGFGNLVNPLITQGVINDWIDRMDENGGM